MTDPDTDPEPEHYGVLPSRRRHGRADDERVNPQDVLDRLRALQVHAWRGGSGDADESQHIGPAAEDFYEALRVGPDADHVPPGDADGVAIAAIQGLADRLDERDELVERYTRRIRRQRGIIEEQRADLESLREQLESLQPEVSRIRLDVAGRD